MKNRIREMAMVALFLLAGAGPASAQGLVEYALVLVCEGCSTGSGSAGRLQIPESLRDDCARSAGVGSICEGIDALEGLPLAAQMADLHEGGWILEETVTVDDATLARVQGSDCSEAVGAEAVETVSLNYTRISSSYLERERSNERTASSRWAASASVDPRSMNEKYDVQTLQRMLIEPSGERCVDEIQERLERGEGRLAEPLESVAFDSRFAAPGGDSSLVFIYFTSL